MIFSASRAVNLLVTKGLGSEPKPIDRKGQILKSAWVVTLATIASQNLRVFPRIPRHFAAGTSVVADSFILVSRIPNLLRRLIGEGSLSVFYTGFRRLFSEKALARKFGNLQIGYFGRSPLWPTSWLDWDWPYGSR